MTNVRIAHTQPLYTTTADGEVSSGRLLIVLADDANHRAMPLWLPLRAAHRLWRLSGPPPGRPAELPRGDLAGGGHSAGTGAGDLAGRLLRAAGVTVSGVEVDELGPEVLAARIEVTGPTGPREVTANLGSGLALAAEMDAPIRVADALMSRLAAPVADDDLLAPFLNRAPAQRPGDPLPRPRNLAFDDGLDHWILGGSFRTGVTGSHWQNYRASAADRSATLSSTVPEPHGDAFLGQVVVADAYRGSTVNVRAEVRAEGVTGRAELFLFIVTRDRARSADLDVTGPEITGSNGWVPLEVAAQVPEDAELIRFGLTLTGRGGGFEDGEIQARGIDVNSAQYQSAYNTCGQPALKAARMSPTDALWSL